MKIIVKHTGMTSDGFENNYLVYLVDENNNSLECTEVTGEIAKVAKEHELIIKHDVTSIRYVTIEEYQRDGLYYDKDYPLILVFYLDAELLKQADIVSEFQKALNIEIERRKANIMVFFIPTEGTERIECINPKAISEVDMERINDMVEEIAKKFDTGQNNNDSELEND